MFAWKSVAGLSADSTTASAPFVHGGAMDGSIAPAASARGALVNKPYSPVVGASGVGWQPQNRSVAAKVITNRVTRGDYRATKAGDNGEVAKDLADAAMLPSPQKQGPIPICLPPFVCHPGFLWSGQRMRANKFYLEEGELECGPQ